MPWGWRKFFCWTVSFSFFYFLTVCLTFLSTFWVLLIMWKLGPNSCSTCKVFLNVDRLIGKIDAKKYKVSIDWYRILWSMRRSTRSKLRKETFYWRVEKYQKYKYNFTRQKFQRKNSTIQKQSLKKYRKTTQKLQKWGEKVNLYD